MAHFLRTTADGPPQTAEGYRIVWCRSSQKADLDARIREAALDKAEAELLDLGNRLNRGKLRHRPNIITQIDKILPRFNCRRFLKVKVAYQLKLEIKRLRRGCPKSDDLVRKARSRIYHLEVTRDNQVLRAETRVDGVFPLVTHLSPKRLRRKRCSSSTSISPT